MAIGLVRYVRARRGCTPGVHIKYRVPATVASVNKGIRIARNKAGTKAPQGQWTLLDSVRHKWTGYLPWAGSYTETREQGLLKWWLERRKGVERIGVPKKTAKARTTKAVRSRSRKTRVKQRAKTVVGKRKRYYKRGETWTD